MTDERLPKQKRTLEGGTKRVDRWEAGVDKEIGGNLKLSRDKRSVGIGNIMESCKRMFK